MKFVKVPGFILMKAEKKNGFEMTEEFIQESMNHKAFDNAPVIFNENGGVKDYTDDESVEQWMQVNVIGVVLPGTVVFDGLYVTGTVMLLEDFSERTKFDNWLLKYDANKSYFIYTSCELFRKEQE